MNYCPKQNAPSDFSQIMVNLKRYVAETYSARCLYCKKTDYYMPL